jgi:hypothetical protein
MTGLTQTFTDKDNKIVQLQDILTVDDSWELKKRGHANMTILTHAGIQKIADAAGISKNVGYEVLIQPNANNNYQLSINATIKRGDEIVNEIGEVNRSNLTSRGKQNPTNMAQKRAYDRAVLRMLGIRGMLSEDELTDESDDNNMDNLTIDQQKKIAPVITKIINAKTTKQLTDIKYEMQKAKSQYTEEELTQIRKQWKKQFAELTKTF